MALIYDTTLCSHDRVLTELLYRTAWNADAV